MIYLQDKNIMIVDFEATCCKNNEFPRDEMEIIEIGAVILNMMTGRVISQFQAFAKPTIHPTLTDFCKSLTNISQLDVDNAKEFEEVYKKWYEWLDDNCCLESNSYWGSWGMFDKSILKSQLILKYPKAKEYLDGFFFNHINLKAVYAKNKGLDERRGVGLGVALNIEGMKFAGSPHRALDDAKNIARLYKYFK